MLQKRSIRLAQRSVRQCSRSRRFLALSCLLLLSSQLAAQSQSATSVTLATGRPRGQGAGASSSALIGFNNPRGSVQIIDFAQKPNFNFSGNFRNAGTLYLVSSSPNVTSGVINAMNFLNLSSGKIMSQLPAGGLTGYDFLVGGFSFALNAARDFTNNGVIASAGSLSISAGNQIINASTQTNNLASMTAALDLNLSSTIGSIVNSSNLSSLAGSINVSAGLGHDLLINNSSGTIQALMGSINIRDSLFSAKQNSAIVGGDVFAKELNFNSGCGIANLNIGNLDAVLNIFAGEAHVNVSAENLHLGQIVLSGDPTFYNTLGSISINSPLVFSGAGLAIIAFGDISSGVGAGSVIDTSSSTGNGGNVSLVAGASFASDSTEPFSTNPNNPVIITVLGASPTGGRIDLGGANPISTIDTRSSAAGKNSGNVNLVAYAGSKAGSGSIATLSSLDIFTAGPAGGKNGDITIIGGAKSGQAVQIGNLDSRGSTDVGGTIIVSNSNPTFPNGVKVVFNNGDMSGAGIFFKSAELAGNISIGKISGMQGINLNAGQVSVASIDNSGFGNSFGSVTITSNSSSSFVIGGTTANSVNGSINLNGASSGNTGARGLSINAVGAGGVSVNDLSLVSFVPGPGGSGGIFNVNADHGPLDIAAGSLNLSGKSGGSFNVTASKINIVGTGPLAISVDGSSANAGSISMSAESGNIHLGTPASGICNQCIKVAMNGTSGGLLAINNAFTTTQNTDVTVDTNGINLSSTASNGLGNQVSIFGRDINILASSISTDSNTSAGSTGQGANLTILAKGNITTAGPVTLSASGGPVSGSGGIISIISNGAVDVSPSGFTIKATGGVRGGSFTLESGKDITLDPSLLSLKSGTGTPPTLLGPNLELRTKNGANILISSNVDLSGAAPGTLKIDNSSKSPFYINSPLTTNNGIKGTLKVGIYQIKTAGDLVADTFPAAGSNAELNSAGTLFLPAGALVAGQKIILTANSIAHAGAPSFATTSLEYTSSSPSSNLVAGTASFPVTGISSFISLVVGGDLTVDTTNPSFYPSGSFGSGLNGGVTFTAGRNLLVIGALNTANTNLKSNGTQPFLISSSSSNGVNGVTGQMKSAVALRVDAGNADLNIPNPNLDISLGFGTELVTKGTLNIGSGSITAKNTLVPNFSIIRLEGSSVNVSGGPLTISTPGNVTIKASSPTADVVLGNKSGQFIINMDETKTSSGGFLNLQAGHDVILDPAFLTITGTSGGKGPNLTLGAGNDLRVLGDLNANGTVRGGNIDLSYNTSGTGSTLFTVGSPLPSSGSGIAGNITANASTLGGAISITTKSDLNVNLTSLITSTGKTSGTLTLKSNSGAVSVTGPGNINANIGASGGAVNLNYFNGQADLIANNISASGDISINAKTVNNPFGSTIASSGGTVLIDASQSLSNTGTINGQKGVSVNTALVTNSGLITSSKGKLTFTASNGLLITGGGVLDSKGNIFKGGKGPVSVTQGLILGSVGGSGTGGFSVTANTVFGTNGTVSSTNILASDSESHSLDTQDQSKVSLVLEQQTRLFQSSAVISTDTIRFGVTLDSDSKNDKPIVDIGDHKFVVVNTNQALNAFVVSDDSMDFAEEGTEISEEDGETVLSKGKIIVNTTSKGTTIQTPQGKLSLGKNSTAMVKVSVTGTVSTVCMNGNGEFERKQLHTSTLSEETPVPLQKGDELIANEDGIDDEELIPVDGVERGEAISAGIAKTSRKVVKREISLTQLISKDVMINGSLIHVRGSKVKQHKVYADSVKQGAGSQTPFKPIAYVQTIAIAPGPAAATALQTNEPLLLSSPETKLTYPVAGSSNSLNLAHGHIFVFPRSNSTIKTAQARIHLSRGAACDVRCEGNSKTVIRVLSGINAARVIVGNHSALLSAGEELVISKGTKLEDRDVYATDGVGHRNSKSMRFAGLWFVHSDFSIPSHLTNSSHLHSLLHSENKQTRSIRNFVLKSAVCIQMLQAKRGPFTNKTSKTTELR